MNVPLRGHRAWIGLTYFLIAATPGFWVPVVSNVLKAQGWSHLITWTFLIPPLIGMFSPLVFAAQADQKLPAEKMLGCILLLGSITLFLAFRELERGLHPERFLIFLAITALITAPSWSLLATITFTYTDHGKGDFGTYRVWATLGWMVAGWVVSSLALDTSAVVGKLSVVTRIATAACCFMLPHTPPKGQAGGDWKDALGLRSLKLLRDRDVAVFLMVSALFAIPLAAFYMHTPRMLESLGIQRVAATMTIGQISEVLAFMVMGAAMRKWKIKWLFLFALLCGLARYVLFAIAASRSSAVPRHHWHLVPRRLLGLLLRLRENLSRSPCSHCLPQPDSSLDGLIQWQPRWHCGHPNCWCHVQRNRDRCFHRLDHLLVAALRNDRRLHPRFYPGL